MKKVIFMIFMVLSLSNIEASEQKLKVVTDVWVPFEDIANKEAPGFASEVISEVLSLMNVDIDIKTYPFARALANVYSGAADAEYTAFYSKERAKHVYYPKESIASAKWLFFVRSDRFDELQFKSYDDLKDKKIGVLRGASISEEFWSSVKKHKNYSEVKLDKFNFKKLMAGRIDYLVTSYANGSVIIDDLGLQGKVKPILSHTIKEDGLYMIFSKKTVSKDFVERFSNQLAKFKNSERYLEIHKKYFR
ncbi:MAG: transporter substrate-binding domain-containing protein [Campylobacterota bacterium]|nr:transporter substrate-binding domain-containing protein [Campylobacterota bacterium]